MGELAVPVVVMEVAERDRGRPLQPRPTVRLLELDELAEREGRPRLVVGPRQPLGGHEAPVSQVQPQGCLVAILVHVAQEAGLLVRQVRTTQVHT